MQIPNWGVACGIGIVAMVIAYLVATAMKGEPQFDFALGVGVISTIVAWVALTIWKKDRNA